MRREVRVFQDKESAESADAGYWLARPVPERIAAVETLRAFLHGTSSRLARVLVVTQREPREVPARRPKDLLDVELMAHLSAKKAPRRRDAAPRVRRTRR
jgi:hypothetical protein